MPRRVGESEIILGCQPRVTGSTPVRGAQMEVLGIGEPRVLLRRQSPQGGL